MIHSWATDVDDRSEMPRWGKVGKQKIEDTGPLDQERMETCDDEFAGRRVECIKRQHKAGKPWFCWLNTTHMHLRTHTKPESIGQAGRWQSPYHDTMIDHDKNVGDMLGLLDELGIAEDTIVLYSTDNGPHMNSWPDGAMTPFRSEKNTNWEGAFRVPGCSAGRARSRRERCRTTSSAARLAADITRRRRRAAHCGEAEEGLRGGGKSSRSTSTATTSCRYLTGKDTKWPRPGFMYFSDDGELVALRFENWKMVFAEQRCRGTLEMWAEPFTPLRVPKLFNLRTDPFEYADITSNTYWDWMIRRRFLRVFCDGHGHPIPGDVRGVSAAASRRASFNIDQAVEKLKEFLAKD